jgi:hypothetical protein
MCGIAGKFYYKIVWDRWLEVRIPVRENRNRLLKIPRNTTRLTPIEMNNALDKIAVIVYERLQRMKLSGACNRNVKNKIS